MFFVIIKQGGTIVCDALLQDASQAIIAPLFEGETYDIEIFNAKAEMIQASKIVAKRKGVTLKLATKLPRTTHTDIKKISQYINQLVSRPRGFDDELEQKLVAIRNMYPAKKYNVDSVRGGRLEHLCYLLFLGLKQQGTIIDVKWRGHLDQYGIPHPAPGRSKYTLGSPDLIIHVDSMIIVLELTLIGKTRKQWSYEGESVPDHILGVKRAFPNMKVVGIFSAPDFHRPEHLKAVAAYPDYSITLKLCKIDQLVSILTKPYTKAEFVRKITSLS